MDMAPTSLTRSALAGVAWNYAGSALLVVAQIASTAATARLIAPSGFGAYASAQAAASFAGFFSMNAIGSGLLRRSQLGPKTIWTTTVLSLAISAVVMLGLWLGASLWAHAWGVPDAGMALAVYGVTVVCARAASDAPVIVQALLLMTVAVVVFAALVAARLRFPAGRVLQQRLLQSGLVGNGYRLPR